MNRKTQPRTVTVRRCRGFRWIDPTAGGFLQVAVPEYVVSSELSKGSAHFQGSISAVVSCKCRLVGWFAGTFPTGLTLPPWVLSFLSRLGVLGSDLGSKPELEDLRPIGLGHAAGFGMPISG